MENISNNNGEKPIFSLLKTHCLEILNLLKNPNIQPSSLPQLLLLLRSTPSITLQPFFDYTLFPLLLLLDGAIDCRSKQGKSTIRVSDSVAENTVQCLEELLAKCGLASIDQMSVVLKKLTYGAMLTPSEASEEFREVVVRCLKALFSNLIPCSHVSCSCQHNSTQFTLLDINIINSLDHNFKPKECLIAFLQSEVAAPAVGHCLSLLLNIAENESSQGLRGSAKIRIEALLTLRVLVAKVGTSDALAFFLPGVITQLAKILHISKSMISGAAGSTEATDHAVRGLAEFLMVVLHDDSNICDPHRSLDSISSENESPHSFLEELRNLRLQIYDDSKTSSNDLSLNAINPREELEEKKSPSGSGKLGPLHVARTRDWLEKTTVNVDTLLSKTFPHICVHPSQRIRRALLYAVQGLLYKCFSTLKRSRLMLLECLCYFVCDDSKDVSMPAQNFLGFLLSSQGKYTIQDDLAEIFNRLLEKLPKLVLGCEETLALASAQQMLAVIYYCGTQLVLEHLLRSPIKAEKLFDVFSLCLSQESVYAGSLGKLVLSRPSTGYLHSLSELKANSKRLSGEYPITNVNSFELSKTHTLVKEIQDSKGYDYHHDYELPRMPPWFACVGSHKLYQALAGILRLVGLSLISDCTNELTLSKIIEIPLENLRNLISEIRMKEFTRESWESWYARPNSGHLLRQAGTATCILNEMIFGMSNQSINTFRDIFDESREKVEERHKSYASIFDQSCHVSGGSLWKTDTSSSARQCVVDCVGTILHEYVCPEVWDLPVIQPGGKFGSIDTHLLRDVATLHQVLIEGIGIFNLTLGEHFTSSGFHCSSLYLLLENLICSNPEVRHASDTVLRLMSTTSGFSSVGELVISNSDYVIDSLCHQLRHLDLNPHVPNVLAAMISCVGVAHKILPLLEEPMRSVSKELEILGRHQHPELTIHFLKAVGEIAKAAKQEAYLLPGQAKSFLEYLKPKVSYVKRKLGDDDTSLGEPEIDDTSSSHDLESMEEWESILFKLNDNKRYCQIVGSIGVSCLTAVTPLLASEKEPICLISLNIIEDGIVTLEKVEEAFKCEKESKEGIEEVSTLLSFYHLKDILEASEGTDENKLLPVMNKIWPFLVACVHNNIPASVRRCTEVITKVIKICGGDFFSRRFHNDGPHFWNLLSTSPFKRKPISSDQKTQLLLPYRSTSRTLEDPISETSHLKTQASILHMIGELARDKRSASSLKVVLKKVSGLVVGIACSGVSGLWDPSIDALSGLGSIDPDLIWVLLADVYYSMKEKEEEKHSSEFPDLWEILPLPSSSKDYLYVQYGGQTYGFEIDFGSVENAFRKLYPEMFVNYERK